MWRHVLWCTNDIRHEGSFAIKAALAGKDLSPCKLYRSACKAVQCMLCILSVQCGVQVTAGTVNYEGPITIKATSTGTDSTLAGIGRLVADAQAREAPVQRLADSVAGKFCYSVMAASAATFGFWSLLGDTSFVASL